MLQRRLVGKKPGAPSSSFLYILFRAPPCVRYAKGYGMEEESKKQRSMRGGGRKGAFFLYPAKKNSSHGDVGKVPSPRPSLQLDRGDVRCCSAIKSLAAEYSAGYPPSENGNRPPARADSLTPSPPSSIADVVSFSEFLTETFSCPVVINGRALSIN